MIYIYAILRLRVACKAWSKPASKMIKPKEIKTERSRVSRSDTCRCAVLRESPGPTHKRTEGRSPLWGSEFTTIAATPHGYSKELLPSNFTVGFNPDVSRARVYRATPLKRPRMQPHNAPLCGNISRPKVEKIGQSRMNKFPPFRSPHIRFACKARSSTAPNKIHPKDIHLPQFSALWSDACTCAVA